MPIDFKNMSDAALEQLARGKKADFSKFEDADLEILAAKPPPKDPGFGKTAGGEMRKGGDVDWLSAIGDTLVNGLHPEASGVGVMENPVLGMASAAGPVAATANAVKGIGGAILRRAPGVVKELGKDAATYLAGEAIDKATGGNHSSGVGLALLRRIGRRGLGKI